MPIFDQYEVEPVSSYSGSYLAKVMNPYGSLILNTGSYARKQIADAATSEILVRSLDNQLMLYSTYFSLSSSAFLGSTQSSFIKSFERVCDITSNEVAYDSLLSSPIDFTSKNVSAFLLQGAGVVYSEPYLQPISKLGIQTIPLSSSISIILGGLGITASLTDGAQEQFIDNKWLYQFPYSSYFKDINNANKRQTPSLNSNSYIKTSLSGVMYGQKSADGITRMDFTASVNTIGAIGISYLSTAPGSGDIFSGFAYQVFFDVPIRISEFDQPEMAAVVEVTQSNFLDKNTFGPNIKDLYKIYFGFGRSGPFGLGNGKYFSSNYINFPMFSINPIIRGWKYGIYSGFPYSLKCTYRVGRYGQVRDMLENRLYTVNFVQQSTNPYTDTPINRTLTYPLQISFVSGTTIYTQTRDYVTATNPSYNPYDSGIYDIYYRSGQPFFDRGNED
jgi:hypothetical protein